MRTAVFATLLALPLFTGCAAALVAGAIGGLVISEGAVGGTNVYETRINLNVDKVWPTVKTTLSDTSMETISVDEMVRMAKANVDGVSVTVTCEAYDLDKTVMRTRASKFAGTVNDADMAQMVQERIVLRLEKLK